MAEDLYNGPSGIRANNMWIHYIPHLPGHALRMNFICPALWENMVWICDAGTSQIRTVRGNYGRSLEEYFIGENGTPNAIWLGLVAYHKHISPDADDAGSYPWIQSRMTFMGSHPVPGGSSYDIVGFNDNETGNPPDNLRVTINHVRAFAQGRAASAVGITLPQHYYPFHNSK